MLNYWKYYFNYWMCVIWIKIAPFCMLFIIVDLDLLYTIYSVLNSLIVQVVLDENMLQHKEKWGRLSQIPKNYKKLDTRRLKQQKQLKGWCSGWSNTDCHRCKHGILSMYTNIVYETVDNLCYIKAQLIHYTNKEDKNLMHSPIEILVK